MRIADALILLLAAGIPSVAAFSTPLGTCSRLPLPSTLSMVSSSGEINEGEGVAFADNDNDSKEDGDEEDYFQSALSTGDFEDIEAKNAKYFADKSKEREYDMAHLLDDDDDNDEDFDDDVVHDRDGNLSYESQFFFDDEEDDDFDEDDDEMMEMDDEEEDEEEEEEQDLGVMAGVREMEDEERWRAIRAAVNRQLVEDGVDIPGTRMTSKNKKKKHKKKKKRSAKFEAKLEQKRAWQVIMDREERSEMQALWVQRLLPFNLRTPLCALVPGSKVRGTVISLTDFGAYVDVGTECDGLLHVSQMSDTKFIVHPKDVVKPGDEIEVYVKSLSVDLKKLHLTMLEKKEIPEYERINDAERIPLEEVGVDDELWGVIKRVTDYGGYVEVGAVVRGFLHFMDHPYFDDASGEHPSTYMKVGDRVRVWVSDVDLELSRIMLTAKRPANLPGPERAVHW